MRNIKAAWLVIPALLGVVALGACKEAHDHPHGPDGEHLDGNEAHDEGHPENGAHPHEAAHGGSVIELGDHAAILEVTHDEAAGEVRIWISSDQGESLAPDGAPVLNAMEGETPTQVEGVLEDGVWVFRHAALNDHQDGARLRLSVGGKTFSPEMPHAH